MIDPTFCDSITLYHQHRYRDEEKKRNVTEWIRSVHNECYFGTQNVQALNGTTLSMASSYICKIPFAIDLNIAPGDIIVKGNVTDVISDVQGQRTTDLLAKYKPDCFTVRTVAANTKIPEDAHYKLTGA